VSFNESSVETTALEWFGEAEEDKTGLIQTAVIRERQKRPVRAALKPSAERRARVRFKSFNKTVG
jgi:hypothetical protein